MFRALRVEVAKLIHQRLTWVSLGALAVLTALFGWGMWQHPFRPDLPGTAGGEFLLAGKLTTAPLLSYMLLRLPVAVTLLMPLMIAVVTGGLVAGERYVGTLRTVLVRPISRLALLAAKLVTAWLHAVVLTFFLGAFALGLGYVLFGRGDLIPLSPHGGLTIFPHGQALARLALGYGLAAVAMISVASLGLFFSTVCDNPLTAAGLTAGFLFVCAALQVIPYFESWKPYLMTTYLDVGNHAFARPVPWSQVGQALTCLLSYAAVAAVSAAVFFSRRDVRC